MIEFENEVLGHLSLYDMNTRVTVEINDGNMGDSHTFSFCGNELSLQKIKKIMDAWIESVYGEGYDISTFRHRNEIYINKFILEIYQSENIFRPFIGEIRAGDLHPSQTVCRINGLQFVPRRMNQGTAVFDLTGGWFNGISFRNALDWIEGQRE